MQEWPQPVVAVTTFMTSSKAAVALEVRAELRGDLLLGCNAQKTTWRIWNKGPKKTLSSITSVLQHIKGVRSSLTMFHQVITSGFTVSINWNVVDTENVRIVRIFRQSVAVYWSMFPVFFMALKSSRLLTAAQVTLLCVCYGYPIMVRWKDDVRKWRDMKFCGNHLTCL